MATFVSVTTTVKVTDGGTTVLDQSYGLQDFEVDNFVTVPFHIAPGGSLVFDVSTTPTISDWVAIAGFAGEVKSPAYLELVFASTAGEPVQVGPGPFAFGRSEGVYLKVTNTSAVVADGTITLFGRMV